MSRRRRIIRKLANTPRALIATVVGSQILFGLLFVALEPTVPWKDWFDGIYLAAVVQSTLGFGDVLPTVWQSKALVIGYVLFCIYFLLPAAIFHFAESNLDDPDEVTDSDLERVECKVDAVLAEVRQQRATQEA